MIATSPDFTRFVRFLTQAVAERFPVLSRQKWAFAAGTNTYRCFIHVE